MSLRPADHEAIRNLYGTYVRAVDTGDLELFTACFAPEATWVYDGLPAETGRNRTFAGQVEINQVAADIWAGTKGHVLHVPNLLTIEGDGDEARAKHYGYVLRRGQTPSAGVLLTDVAEDTLVRTSGRWLFSARTGHIDSHRAAPAATDVLVTARDAQVDAGLAAGRADRPSGATVADPV